MRWDRGFSLIEVTVAVGIIALFATTGAGLTLANRSLAVAAAASEFDQLLDSARTTAHAVGGGQLTFTPDTPDQGGTVVTFATRDADGTLQATTLPALHTHARITEQETLGDPTFALVLHADGRLRGIPHAGTDEVACPASGSYHLHIAAGGGSADRYLPCRTILAAGAPLAYTTWPPATTAPTPTADCGPACTAPSLPTASSPALSCPAGTTAVGTTCVPVTTPTPMPTATPTLIAIATSTPAPTPTPAPTATPTTAACDLVQNGTCYRRIAGPTLEFFDKTVSPGSTCDSMGVCQWANKVGSVSIYARDSYSIQPPIVPNDASHGLLFVVDGIAAMRATCAPFHVIRDLSFPPPGEVSWNVLAAGRGGGNIEMSNLAPGYGEPAVFAYRYRVARSSTPIAGTIVQDVTDATQYSQTIDELANAAQQPIYGPVAQSKYTDISMKQGEYVTYVPDFTDCASGLPDSREVDDQLYGITTVVLVVETYQAISQ